MELGSSGMKFLGGSRHMWKARTTANTSKQHKELPQEKEQLHNLHHLRMGWANVPQESSQPFYSACCNSTHTGGIPSSPFFNVFCIPWNWRRTLWKWVKGIYCFLSNVTHTSPSFTSSFGLEKITDHHFQCSVWLGTPVEQVHTFRPECL